jgi:hypothetical protein
MRFACAGAQRHEEHRGFSVDVEASAATKLGSGLTVADFF